ncbi:MAG: TolB family protein [bacterium]|nr:TolB family protein [bacterium]
MKKYYKIIYLIFITGALALFSACDPSLMEDLIFNNLNEANYQPAWSPDGSKIVYRSSRRASEDLNSDDPNYDDHIFSIVVMSSSGTNQNILIEESWALGYHPAWSPDGTKIVFSLSGDGEKTQIFIMNADGSGQTGLTENGDSSYDYPSFSHDGKQIILVKDDNTICSLDVDSLTITDILHADNKDFREPSWSPDGSKIVYTDYSNIYTNYKKIYTIDSNGSDPILIANGSYPSWSPDGLKIIYSRNNSSKDNYSELTVLDLETGINNKLISSKVYIYLYPKYSPDGSTIVFEGGQYKEVVVEIIDHQIYKMNADGTQIIQLTGN